MFFYKYHSLENDFILFDVRSDQSAYTLLHDNPEHIQHLCHRRQGIGADGIIFIHATHTSHDAKLTITNADGSDGELCLNGLRCAAHMLHSHTNTLSFLMAQQTFITTQTSKDFILTTAPAAQNMQSLNITQKKTSFRGTLIHVPSPHFILDTTTTYETFVMHAPLLAHHAAFPHGTNVEYIDTSELNTHRLTAAIYERGVGFSQACSSGAIAIASLLKHHAYLEIIMPGGTIKIKWKNKHELLIEAQAKHVYSGTIEKK